MTAMDEYRQAVAAALVRRNGSPILSNRSFEHAAVVLEHLLNGATKSVEILSNRLELEVYNKAEVIEAAKKVLGRDGRIDILVESEPTMDHPFLRAITSCSNSVSFTRVPDGVQKFYDYNFCVVDDDCYRFEPNRKACDATIQFGNPLFAGKLRERFREIHALCTPPPDNARGTPA